MNWYEKLSQYFPIEEMKSKKHIETLLQERSNIYHKNEGPHHVLMYVETDQFIFIDYLFVSKDARGQGLGGKLIDELKQHNKPIILEVEPVTIKIQTQQNDCIFINVQTLSMLKQSAITAAH